MTRVKRLKLTILGIATGINAIMLHEARKQRDSSNVEFRDAFDTEEYSNRYNH